MEIALALAVIAVPLWLNVKATRAVLLDEFLQRGQRLVQLLLVWLVPLIGAGIVLAVHRSAETPSRRYREPADPGDDFAYTGRALKNTREALDGDN